MSRFICCFNASISQNWGPNEVDIAIFSNINSGFIPDVSVLVQNSGLGFEMCSMFFHVFPVSSEPDNIKTATRIYHHVGHPHPTWRKISKILPSLMNPFLVGVSLTWHPKARQTAVDRQSKQNDPLVNHMARANHMARPLSSASCGWAIPGTKLDFCKTSATSPSSMQGQHFRIFSCRVLHQVCPAGRGVHLLCRCASHCKLHVLCVSSIFNAQPTRDSKENRADFRLTT